MSTYRQALEVFVGESVPKSIVGKFSVPQVSAWHRWKVNVTSCWSSVFSEGYDIE